MSTPLAGASPPTLSASTTAAATAVTYSPIASPVPNPPPLSCGCCSGNLQIASLSQNYEQVSSSAQETGTTTTHKSFLADTLGMGRILVQHWGTLNGCAKSESHMNAQTLCSMVAAIDVVLRDHEMAIDTMSRSLEAHATGWNNTRTSVGRLELDPTEAAIVAQEALKHSLVRMAAVLQDIEEEAALQGPSEAEYLLPEKDIKNIITRLFRMLGSVNKLKIT